MLSPVVAHATPDAAPEAGPASPSWQTLAFTADGTLVAVGQSVVVARAPDGTIARQPIEANTSVAAGEGLRGVVLQQGDELTLLATPTLQTLYTGKGAAATGWMVAAVILPGEVLAQGGAGLVRLALPKGADPVERVVLLASGTRFDVSFHFAGDAGQDEVAGRLYDAQTGALVGPGLPLMQISPGAPLAAHALLSGYVVDGHRVRRIALDTGKVVRQTIVRCPAERVLGNPTPSPDGTLLLVTCDGDGIVLDGNTLAEHRRIPSILPGCDNGPVLGGSILLDQHTLLVGGCGGEARLDLSRGRYECGDAEGLLGAPYMAMAPTGSAPWQPPPDRQGVARCTREGSEGAYSVGHTGRYRIEYAEATILTGPGVRFDIGEMGGSVALDPEERSFAYVRGGKALVRALPSGATLAEIAAE